MAALTHGTIRGMVRQRADIENSTHITDAEIDQYIYDSVFECFEIRVGVVGHEVAFTDKVDLYTVSGTQTYTLTLNGTDLLYKVQRVDVAFDSIRVPFRSFNLTDEVLDDTARTWDHGTDLKYMINQAGVKISFHPVPNAVHSVRVYYISLPTPKTNDSSTYQGITPWEEYVAISAAIKCMVKEESDTAALERQLANITDRIVRWGSSLDVARPTNIADHRALDDVGHQYWLDRFV
jgi:hypothetical protein